MQNFAYAVAQRPEDACAADGISTMPIAGGTELLNWFRLGITAPSQVIDIGRLEDLRAIEHSGDRLTIGALATLNMIGEHTLVRDYAAVLADACLKAASAQIRSNASASPNSRAGSRSASSGERPWP